MQSRRFIQQALDPEYGHPAFETMLVVPVWRPRARRSAIGAILKLRRPHELS
jgi:hypothetical protein